jgi:hypothetical protein
MPFKINLITGNLDYYEVVTIKETIKSILLASKKNDNFTVASILFDEDSILYNDDEEELL